MLNKIKNNSILKAFLVLMGLSTSFINAVDLKFNIPAITQPAVKIDTEDQQKALVGKITGIQNAASWIALNILNQELPSEDTKKALLPQNFERIFGYATREKERAISHLMPKPAIKSTSRILSATMVAPETKLLQAEYKETLMDFLNKNTTITIESQKNTAITLAIALIHATEKLESIKNMQVGDSIKLEEIEQALELVKQSLKILFENGFSCMKFYVFGKIDPADFNQSTARTGIFKQGDELEVATITIDPSVIDTDMSCQMLIGRSSKGKEEVDATHKSRIKQNGETKIIVESKVGFGSDKKTIYTFQNNRVRLQEMLNANPAMLAAIIVYRSIDGALSEIKGKATLQETLEAISFTSAKPAANESIKSALHMAGHTELDANETVKLITSSVYKFFGVSKKKAGGQQKVVDPARGQLINLAIKYGVTASVLATMTAAFTEVDPNAIFVLPSLLAIMGTDYAVCKLNPGKRLCDLKDRVLNRFAKTSEFTKNAARFVLKTASDYKSCGIIIPAAVYELSKMGYINAHMAKSQYSNYVYQVPGGFKYDFDQSSMLKLVALAAWMQQDKIAEVIPARVSGLWTSLKQRGNAIFDQLKQKYPRFNATCGRAQDTYKEYQAFLVPPKVSFTCNSFDYA